MKKFYFVIHLLYLFLCGYLLFNIVHDSFNWIELAIIIGAILLSFITPLIFKLLKYQPVYSIYSLALIFIFIAAIGGSVLGWYKSIPYFDKIAHGLSGVLGAYVGYIVYCLFRQRKKIDLNEVGIMTLFINCFNISIAVIWELYEFLCLVLLDYDAIKHYSTGVYDVMGDIIVCIIGGIITTLLFVAKYRYHFCNYITSPYEEFYEKNILK